MRPAPITVLKLSSKEHPERGLSVKIDGVYLGGSCRLIAVAKDASGRTFCTVRQKRELDVLLSAAYDYPVDATQIRNALGNVARALEERNLFKATLIATHLGWPQIPDAVSVARLIGADRLLKANFNPDEPRDERGRWTSDGRLDSRESPTSTAGRQIAESDQERHNRCVQECLHLLPSPTGDLQHMEYHKCYGECMRGWG